MEFVLLPPSYTGGQYTSFTQDACQSLADEVVVPDLTRMADETGARLLKPFALSSCQRVWNAGKGQNPTIRICGVFFSQEDADLVQALLDDGATNPLPVWNQAFSQVVTGSDDACPNAVRGYRWAHRGGRLLHCLRVVLRRVAARADVRPAPCPVRAA